MVSFVIKTILLALGYFILIQHGRLGFKLLSVSLGVKNRRPKDISHLQPEPPTIFQEAITALLALGFTRLGESGVNVNGTQVNTWVFVSLDKLTTAEVVVAAPMLVGFSTAYKDTSVVETNFPVGESIETPLFISHTIKSSIEKAYNHQNQLVMKFSKTHGAPLSIESMQEYLRLDVVYRKNMHGANLCVLH